MLYFFGLHYKAKSVAPIDTARGSWVIKIKTLIFTFVIEVMPIHAKKTVKRSSLWDKSHFRNFVYLLIFCRLCCDSTKFAHNLSVLITNGSSSNVFRLFTSNCVQKSIASVLFVIFELFHVFHLVFGIFLAVSIIYLNAGFTISPCLSFFNVLFLHV